ncbi:MAG: glycosyltransferase family 2 protein [Lachnospiraceae bacterium]|nr:glycosyltransferase family 2 protein [Lachnospiraceae bacterium]
MKLLSIAVPCYNSQDYMEHCVDSLLPGGEDVEIIIVDDGSSDRTAEIADKYAADYPGIVKAVHQENGGHGEAVNRGLKEAKGLYFKVVDSDDWVDQEAYRIILDKLREVTGGPVNVDMVISNFVYDKQGAWHKKIMHYTLEFPHNRVFTWPEVYLAPKGKYLLMHSVIFRTKLLRACKLELPKHTFYVDNLYVYQPLPFVKNMIYLDVDFYHYFIGRDDQSVNEKVMISRIDQQIRVNKLMLDSINPLTIHERKLRRYLFNYLEIVTTVSTVMCLRGGTEEFLEKKRELWGYIREKDLRLFHRLRNGVLGFIMNIPGKGGRRIGIAAYQLTQKLVGFN